MIAVFLDTVTTVAGRIPDVLDVRLHDDAISIKDIAAWVIQAIVAFGAAWLGAWWGGRQAQKSAADAIRTEYELERDQALTRLRSRVRSNLIRLGEASGLVQNVNTGVPFDAKVGEELEIVWNLYYRESEHIFGLTSEALAERIERIFADAHSLAENIKANDHQARSAQMEINTNATRVVKDCTIMRGRYQAEVVVLSAAAKQLFKDFGTAIATSAKRAD